MPEEERYVQLEQVLEDKIFLLAPRVTSHVSPNRPALLP